MALEEPRDAFVAVVSASVYTMPPRLRGMVDGGIGHLKEGRGDRGVQSALKVANKALA